MSEPDDQFLLSELAFASATFPQGIDERQQLIQEWIPKGSSGSVFVQRFETDAPLVTFRKRPHRRRLGPGVDQPVERWRGIRRGNSTSELARLHGKRILHSVCEEFLDGFEQRTVFVRIARHESRTGQPLQRGVNFGGADREIHAHLSDGRTTTVIAQELCQNEHVLGSQAGRHSMFANREYRIACLGGPARSPPKRPLT